MSDVPCNPHDAAITVGSDQSSEALLHLDLSTRHRVVSEAVAAAPLNGVSDQDRIVSAVKRTKASVVAITETINGQQVVPIDPMIQQFFGQLFNQCLGLVTNGYAVQ